jgi:hypothetical protein
VAELAADPLAEMSLYPVNTRDFGTRDFGTRDFGLGMMQAYNPYESYGLPHAENPLPDVPISASGYR